MADRDTEGQNPPKRRFAWMSISLSAFIMSLVATLISAFYSLQGAEVVIQPPKQALLYRSGEGENSVLAVAMRIELINAASSHGDVLLDAELAPVSGGPSFGLEGLVTPTLNPRAAEAAGNCDLSASCTGLPGLLLVHRSDEIMALPAGGARALVPYFWLSESSCNGGKACERFQTFNRAVEGIGRGPIELTMTLRFYDDGQRKVTCRTRPIDAAYLREIGWTQIACVERGVSGAPLF